MTIATHSVALHGYTEVEMLSVHIGLVGETVHEVMNKFVN